jgi:hypothetical protein
MAEDMFCPWVGHLQPRPAPADLTARSRLVIYESYLFFVRVNDLSRWLEAQNYFIRTRQELASPEDWANN